MQLNNSTILHLGKYYPPFMGGIENFMYSLTAQQCDDGHHVSAIVHHHEKKQPFKTELDNSVSVFRVPCLGQLAYAPISPLFSYYLNKVIATVKPDVIHIHMPNLSAFWCLLLPNARKVPWVIHWHADVIGSVPDLKIKLLYPFYRLFEKAILKKAKKIIATSPVYFESSAPLQPFVNKVEVVPLGLFNKQLVANKKNVYENNLKLLVVGRLTYYKGHKLLLDALSILKKQEIIISLTIIGNGELKGEISELIIQSELSSQVTLLNNLSNEELEQQLTETDLLCLPSIERTEAFGVVLLEAMRASKPCLVTNVSGSGMSWVVQDNETGFVVKHNDVNSLADKLKFIVEHQKLLPQYGAAGRKRFEQCFVINSVSKQVTNIYKSL